MVTMKVQMFTNDFLSKSKGASVFHTEVPLTMQSVISPKGLIKSIKISSTTCTGCRDHGISRIHEKMVAVW